MRASVAMAARWDVSLPANICAPPHASGYECSSGVSQYVGAPSPVESLPPLCGLSVCSLMYQFYRHAGVGGKSDVLPTHAPRACGF